MLSAMAPHGREMSQDLRKKIISLHKKGEGYKKISKALLISQNTVAKVVQTFKKDGTATISQRRPGHPRKLTPRQERLLMRRVEENRHASSLQLSKEVESQTGVTISRDTIRRTLQRNGMHGCRPRKKPLLKPRHKKARLEFARAHADKDEDYWDSIHWSDETKINVFLELMASKLYGVAKVRNTKRNAWCLQWNMVVAVSLCGAARVLLVSGSCISLMASWIHKCTALYWKRRCYHHSVPLVVVHFSNMTMILNTHLRPLLDFWRRTGWKWFSGQVCLLIWTQSNTYSEETSWASLSIQHPISKRAHSWRMEKDRSGRMSLTCSFHA